MPEYRYQAHDSKGANVRGTMNAVDEADLQKKLRTQGVMLLEAKPTKRKKYLCFLILLVIPKIINATAVDAMPIPYVAASL